MSEPIDFVLKLGAIQGFFFFFVLFFNKKHNVASKVLSILVLLIGITCLFYSFNSLEFYTDYPHLLRLNWGIPLLFGPLLFLYTKYLLFPANKFNKTDLKLAIPYILNLLILAPFFITGGEDKLASLDYFTAAVSIGVDNYAIYFHVLQLSIIGLGLHFSLKSLNMVKAYHIGLKQDYASLESVKLQWLHELIWAFIVLFILLIILILRGAYDKYLIYDYQVIFYIGFAVLVYMVSFKTFRLKELTMIQTTHKPIKTVKAAIIINLGEDGKRLKTYLNEHKPYLDNKLTAVQLAEQLEWSRHKLSEVLNTQIGQNFYDFINAHRIDEFVQRMSDGEHQQLTFLALAYDCGFSSKSSFNSAFKKHTGFTPSQYRKKMSELT